MKYLLKISYLGTSYCGFQIQPNAATIQGELEKAARSVLSKDNIVSSGCSRTDAGVHAKEYYVCIQSDGCPEIANENMTKAMNTFLPDDICVKKTWAVKNDFRIKRAVAGKRYVYLINNAKTPDPFTHDRSFFYPRSIDTEIMNRGAEIIVGRHDFKSFMASGSEIENTVRNVTECSVSKEGDFIEIRVSADGFLYNMVRIICGTLLEMSEGKISVDELKTILDSCDRKTAGRTLPGCGLYLDEVFLDKEYLTSTQQEVSLLYRRRDEL